MINKICSILDRRAFLVWPWEDPKNNNFGKDYVLGCPSPGAIGKRRRAAMKKAEQIMELLNHPGDGK